MLDIKQLKHDPETIRHKLKKRGFDFDIEKFQTLEGNHKKYQLAVETLQAKRNRQAKMIGQAKARGENVAELIQSVDKLGDELHQAQQKFNQADEELKQYLLQLPNLLHESVPDGKDENDNVELRHWGEPKKFTFPIKDHVDLGEAKQWMDFKTATKLAGSRFVVLYGPLARLQRALIQFMLDLHTQAHGYQEIYVPSITNKTSLYGTGQLPKFSEDLFHLENKHDYALISTSEIQLANTVRDDIIDVDSLPIKYVCHSACFRSEAGSYGRDTRGMIRQHQFEKVEMVQIVKPEASYQALEALIRHAETVLQKLELPYRVVSLCSGDTGFSAAKTYDLEVWLPSQNCYREISSCSNCEDFQARRMKARYRQQGQKPVLVHTLNGSGLAVGRTLVAVLENYQDERGDIHIPEALQAYMGGKTIL
ncbi:MAG: serine--tRNA ligase [Pseudomonadota bacterium]